MNDVKQRTTPVHHTYENAASIQNAVNAMRVWFNAGHTQPLHERRMTLQALQHYLKQHEQEALSALKDDLGKSFFEGFTTEVGLVYDELRLCLKKLYAWGKPKHVSTPLVHFPASSKVYPAPYGVAAIMSPWNYPLQLALVPLVDALAAGNCVMLKPSQSAPATSAFLQALCEEVFNPMQVRCLPVGGHINDWILEAHFDKIFFTGSTHIGKKIMHTAADQLCDVTLELGGKSPCIIAQDANIKRAAQRIAWGKCLNSGQTCVAPDYAVVHESIRDEFVAEFKGALRTYFGDSILDNNDYPHLINEHHFDRVCGLIDHHNPNAKVVIGGKRNRALLKIEPTLMVNVTLDDPVMDEEIFGSVLPILTWKTYDELMEIIRHYPAPLACYVFSESTVFQQQIITQVPFGGATINDVVIHLANNHMGFGGFKESGIGSYHGKAGFDCFTHYKSTLKKSVKIELPIRNPPFTDFKLKLARLFMR